MRWFALAAVALLVLATIGQMRSARAPGWGDVHVFPDVEGPHAPSTLKTPEPADWRRFDSGGTGRLAVLLTDPDSAWLGLVSGLRSHGIPFVVTDEPERALRHQVVLIYPRLSGAVFQPATLRALGDFAREGGTLLAVNVLGGGLDAVFGFEGVRARRDHMRVRFDAERPLLAGLADPRESEIRIAATDPPATRIGSHDYLAPAEPPLAVYEDGAAAVVQRRFATGGRALALGFDPGLLLLKACNRRLEGVSDAYANAFDPSADVPMRLLAAAYRSGEPLAVTVEPVPDGRALALMLTHDIDYSESLANAVVYAEMARDAGVRATFFVQTKYVRDWNDDAFFDDAGAGNLARLAELDMEIASHSVSHSLVFDTFPLGDGREHYPAYRPFVKSGTQTYDATILGELRVSRFLLERLGDAPVVSFRPGHLANPKVLPQALEASGYRFSSSVSANVSLTHLPFRLNHGRGTEAETGVFEFPVTIEDELGEPLLERLDDALDVAARIAKHGGAFVVLVHPNVIGEKLVFEQRLLAALRDEAWLGALGDYGRWWASRDSVSLDVVPGPDGDELRLHAPTPIDGLTLRLPPGFTLEKARPVASRPDRWVLDRVEGDIRLALRPGHG